LQLFTIEASTASMLATTVITAAVANTQPNVTSNFFISPELLMQLAVEEYDCL
jgi:hypothetical protein